MIIEPGDVAVVTGAGGGIGLAVAQRLAAEGMRVVLVDVNADLVASVTADLSATGADVIDAVADVTSPEQMDALRDRVIDRFGSVSLVMNNAGIGAHGRVWELSPAAWRSSVDVNVLGVVNGMRSFVPLLVAQNRGHVVNTASMAGLVPRPYWSPYCATKFAVAALTEAAFHELADVAPGVGISVLCPGPVSTQFLNPDRVLDARGEHGVPERATKAHDLTVQYGISTSEVAARVFEAVRDNRFYVLTHPEMAGQVAVRADDIVAGRQPTLQ